MRPEELYLCPQPGVAVGVTIPGVGETVTTNISRFRPGADKEIINARLDDMIQKYRPEEDKKAYGYTAFVKPSVMYIETKTR